MLRLSLRLLALAAGLALCAALAHPLLMRASRLPAPLGHLAEELASLSGEAERLMAGASASPPSPCERHGALPDRRCTPGAVFSGLSLRTLCAYGYVARARDVPDALKRHIYASYGITQHRPGAYEIDHLIPLAIGGSNSARNLWPQPAPFYRAKDRLEATLARAVCERRVSLAAAQRAIAGDWQRAAASLSLQRP